MTQTPDEFSLRGFNGILDYEYLEQTPDRVVAQMRVTEELMQPFGYLHGGATLGLLEAVASRGAELRSDFDVERPFGLEIHARHWRSGQLGDLVQGIAEIDHVEGSKQYWRVSTHNEAGEVMSEGIFVTKIVSLERLAQKDIKVPAIDIPVIDE